MILIQPFEKENDICAVMQLTAQIAAFHGDTSKLTEEFLMCAVNSGQLEIIIAFDNDQPAGFMALQRRIGLVHAFDTMVIDLIVVDENHRRSGIGKHLVSHAAKLVIDRKMTAVSLGVRQSNPQALSFYKAMQFRIEPWNDRDFRCTLDGDALKNIAQLTPD